MRVIRTRQEMVNSSEVLRQAGEKIAFIPTMGSLHAGHLSLMELAKGHSTKRVASIFVNPKQFNVQSDFDNYPSDEERDFALLRDVEVDLVFAPGREEIYPAGHETEVAVGELADRFEGTDRPGHFQGVATVVSILFNLVRPHVALFGEKDFQQVRIVERLVTDLGFPMEIVRAPLIRDTDGLALSSRNVRLSKEGRGRALQISKALYAVKERFSQGERDVEKMLAAGWALLNATDGVDVEYFEAVRERDLNPVKEIVGDEPYRILTAAYVDGVRLLDNIGL